MALGGHIQEICISPPLSGLCALLAWSGVCVPGWAAGPRDESKPDPRPLGRAGARPDGCEVCLSKTFYKRLSGGVFLPRGAYFVYRAVLSQLQTTRGTRYFRRTTTPARVVPQSANHRGTRAARPTSRPTCPLLDAVLVQVELAGPSAARERHAVRGRWSHLVRVIQGAGSRGDLRVGGLGYVAGSDRVGASVWG